MPFHINTELGNLVGQLRAARNECEQYLSLSAVAMPASHLVEFMENTRARFVRCDTALNRLTTSLGLSVATIKNILSATGMIKADPANVGTAYNAAKATAATLMTTYGSTVFPRFGGTVWSYTTQDGHAAASISAADRTELTALVTDLQTKLDAII